MEVAMNKTASWLCGAASGATLIYFFDPERGRRRRALLRDQVLSRCRSLSCDAGKVWRDLNHRTSGYVHEVSAHLMEDEPSEEQLVARVRSKMGRYVSNPGAITVTAQGGRVHLSGRVFSDEVHRLISALKSLRGVGSIDHDLEVHDPHEDVPELPRRRARYGEQLNLFEENWAPATRAVVGTAGAVMLMRGLLRRSPLSIVQTVLGAGLLARCCQGEMTGEGGASRQMSPPQQDRTRDERPAMVGAFSARST
jgi:hypothetical protein